MNVKLVQSDPGRPNLDLVGSCMFTFMIYTHALFPFQHQTFGWKVNIHEHPLRRAANNWL